MSWGRQRWLQSLRTHYGKPELCRVLYVLPSAKIRALGKEVFAESRSRQSMTLGKEPLCRVPDTRRSLTLGKEALCRVPGTRQRLTVVHTVSLCRVSLEDTRQRGSLPSVKFGTRERFFFYFFASKLFCTYFALYFEIYVKIWHKS